MSVADGLKRSFVAGLLLVMPLIVTVYVLRIAFDWLVQFINPVVRWTRLSQYTANIEIAAQALTAFLILTAIIALGYLAQRRTGQRVFGGFDRAVAFIPLVSTMYGSVRQVANSLIRGSSRYESVVLVEHPRLGVYSIGLVTGESPATIDVSGERLYNVFLPNSPNPTAGRLVLVPEDQLHAVDVSVRRGLRLLVTTGLGDEESPQVPAL